MIFLKHLGTKFIETERLLLREFFLDDANAMFNNYAGDDEVTKYLTWPTHQSAAESEAVISEWLPDYEKEECYNWAIELKELGEIIGAISAFDINEKVEKLQVGYCIGKKWWNQGITTEALKAVMDFLFDEVGAKRIEARHDTQNVYSGKVMRKCGMKYEGTHRQSDYNNQGVCDTAWYALLKDERF